MSVKDRRTSGVPGTSTADVRRSAEGFGVQRDGFQHDLTSNWSLYCNLCTTPFLFSLS